MSQVLRRFCSPSKSPYMPTWTVMPKTSLIYRKFSLFSLSFSIFLSLLLPPPPAPFVLSSPFPLLSSNYRDKVCAKGEATHWAPFSLKRKQPLHSMTNNDFSLFSGFDGVSKVCLIGPQVESKTQKAISVFNREIQNKAPGAKKSQFLEKS